MNDAAYQALVPEPLGRMLGIEDDGARQSALAHRAGNFHVQIAGFSHFSVHIGLGLQRLHIRIEADFVSGYISVVKDEGIISVGNQATD